MSEGRMAEPDYLEYVVNPSAHLSSVQQQFLSPLVFGQKLMQRGLYFVNKTLMHAVFRLQVFGSEQLPAPPFLLAPNHTSTLDPAAIAAGLDYDVLCRTRWAGRQGAVLRTPLRRGLNRLAQTVPIKQDVSALAAATEVLRRQENLVWFPEGTRTQTGELQEFQPGIGILMQQLDVPAVPVFIQGAYEAMPPSRTVPRVFSPIKVFFGAPLRPSAIIDPTWKMEQQVDELVAELRRRIQELQNSGEVSVAFSS